MGIYPTVVAMRMINTMVASSYGSASLYSDPASVTEAMNSDANPRVRILYECSCPKMKQRIDIPQVDILTIHYGSSPDSVEVAGIHFGIL